ncbi:MAG: hypothetical protein ACRD96_11150 [Bryobacteraceae bacterium]
MEVKNMRTILSLVATTAVFSMLAFAENWSGRLLDGTCYEQQKKIAGCEATSKSTAFALEASGKIFKLDSAGNSKAAEALKNRADRSEPGQTQAKEVMAKVTGAEKSGTIAVESIQVQ